MMIKTDRIFTAFLLKEIVICGNTDGNLNMELLLPSYHHPGYHTIGEYTPKHLLVKIKELIALGKADFFEWHARLKSIGFTDCDLCPIREMDWSQWRKKEAR